MKLVIKKDGNTSSVVTSKSASSPTHKSATTTKKSELVVVQLSGIDDQCQQSVTIPSASVPADAESAVPPEMPQDVKEEGEEDGEEEQEEEDSSISAARSIMSSTNDPLANLMDDYIVKPRRCSRLQRDDIVLKQQQQHDSDTCPLGGQFFSTFLSFFIIKMIFLFKFRWRWRNESQSTVFRSDQCQQEGMPLLHDTERKSQTDEERSVGNGNRATTRSSFYQSGQTDGHHHYHYHHYGQRMHNADDDDDDDA